MQKTKVWMSCFNKVGKESAMGMLRQERIRQSDPSAMEIRPFLVFRRMTRRIGMAVPVMAVSLFLFIPGGRALTAAANDTAPTATTQTENQAQASGPVENGVAADQAGVRVARLSDVEGTVQIFRGDQMEFPKAVMNMPVPQGSRIETGADSRVEIEFEDGSVARITPSSSLSIETLGTSANGAAETVLKQRSGLVYYELRSDGKTLYTVLLDQGAVHPKVNSTFRVDLTTAPAALAVIDGDVQVRGTSNDSLTEAHQGQMIQLHPSATAQYTVIDGIIPNGFDEWNDQRDQEAAKQTANQTSARMQQGNSMDSGIGYGWSDLDTYGGWYPLPGYGMVWQPYGVGAGFDPYGFGNWADIDGFGVSWISGYPWGWLPFNCGGWSYINSFGWGWLPGGCGFGGGIGYGYGFGYGGYGRYRSIHHRHPYTHIYRGPAGYRAPVPPANLRAGTGIRNGRPARNLVPVGNGTFAGRQVGGNRVNDVRSVHFNGTKIAPLHSGMSRTFVPTRNAALYNNYPAHAFPGGVRNTLQRPTRGLRESSVATRAGGSHAMRAGPSRGQSFGATNRESFVRGNAFGQHTVFGSHGSFGETHSSFQNGGAFRGMGRRAGFGAGGSMGGGGFHGGMSSGGEFHGGASRSGSTGGSAGFRGGGVSSGSTGGGFHGGGMSSGGGGFHGGGGGGFHGGGGGGHSSR